MPQHYKKRGFVIYFNHTQRIIALLKCSLKINDLQFYLRLKTLCFEHNFS